MRTDESVPKEETVSWPPTWSTLNRARTIRVLKLSYAPTLIIPLYALAITYLRDVFGLPSIHLSGTLFVVYLGSLSLSVATVLNEMFCPWMIKEFASVDHYGQELVKQIARWQAVGRTQERLRRQSFKRDFNVLSHSEKGLEEHAERYMAEAHKAIDNLIQSSDSELEKWIQQLGSVEKDWHHQNILRRPIRWIITVGYGFSVAVAICYFLIIPAWRVGQAYFG